MGALRSTASLTISFGLVSVPVKLYSAAESGTGVSFNMLHAACSKRVKQQYVCPDCKGSPVVERDAMVKGYEVAKDRFVTFTADEIKALSEPASSTLSIEEFVPAGAIDPLHFDKGYFVGPGIGGGRGYALLAEAMRSTGRVAIGRYVGRGREHVAAIRAIDGGLVLHTLLFADEVRSIEQVPMEREHVKPHELKLATQIIEQAAVESFDPSRFEDGWKKRVLAQIERRAEGLDLDLQEDEAPEANVVDLMAALEASVSKGKGKTPKAKATKGARKAAR